MHALELGSNTAMVAAANLSRATFAARDAFLGNSGQARVPLQRVFVAREVFDEFEPRRGPAPGLGRGRALRLG